MLGGDHIRRAASAESESRLDAVPALGPGCGRLSADLRGRPLYRPLLAILAAAVVHGYGPGPSSQPPSSMDTAQMPEFPRFTLQDHFDNLKPLLAEYANRPAGDTPDDRVLVDRRLIQSLLVQNYMLMRLVAQNDPKAADLLEDIDLVLREIKNMEADDPEAPGMIHRLIQSRDILFKINVLQEL